MFTNRSATTPNSSFNNNNNLNQPNLNNHTGIFSVPTNPSNNSFGNLPPQPTTFGSIGRSVELLGNPQLPGATFGGMGGGFDFSKIHTHAPRSTIPPNGTVDYIGRNNVEYFFRNKDGHYICSMTAKIVDHTLDEQRMADYYNLKNNRLKTDEKRTIFLVIHRNLGRINPHESHPQSRTIIPPILDGIMKDPTISSFTTNMTNSQIPPLSKSQTSGSLLTNLQPLQTVSSPLLISNQPSVIQSIQTPKALNEQPEIKSMKPIEKKKPLELNSGSFSYEFNKMFFVSGLVQLMEKHNMTVPENLLDDTDFVTQLLAFLEQHNIHLPTENIPQFHIDECE